MAPAAQAKVPPSPAKAAAATAAPSQAAAADPGPATQAPPAPAHAAVKAAVLHSTPVKPQHKAPITAPRATPAAQAAPEPQAGTVATPPAPAAPVAPAPAAHVRAPASVVAQPGQPQAAQATGAVSLRLDPPGLGPVHVRLHLAAGGALLTHFVVSDPGARSAIQASLGALRSRLIGHGLQVRHLDVSLGGRQSDGHRPPPESRGSGRTASGYPGPVPPKARPLAAVAGALNLLG